jgi:predicted nucleic acid-binding protein
MSLVLDASITLAWIYAEETTEAVLQVFEVVKSEGAWIPALWKWEIANVLETNARHGRHGRDFCYEVLAALSVFDIQVDAESEDQAWSDAFELAHHRRLTVYDAAYLEVAIRRKIPLATLDRELRAAATAEGVRLFGI